MSTTESIKTLTGENITLFSAAAFLEPTGASYNLIDEVNLIGFTDTAAAVSKHILKVLLTNPTATATRNGLMIRIEPATQPPATIKNNLSWATLSKTLNERATQPATPEESNPMNPSNTSKLDGAELAEYLAARFPTPATQPATTEEAAPMSTTESIKTLTIDQLTNRAGHIPADLIRATVAQFGDWLYFQESAENIAEHGAAGGFSGFSYYHDTVRFFDDNREPILKMAAEMAADCGYKSSFELMAAFNCFAGLTDQEIFNALIDPEAEEATIVKNGLAWFAFEEVARAVYDYQNDDDDAEEDAGEWEAEEEEEHPVIKLCRSWLNGNISQCIEETKRHGYTVQQIRSVFIEEFGADFEAATRAAERIKGY